MDAGAEVSENGRMKGETRIKVRFTLGGAQRNEWYSFSKNDFSKREGGVKVHKCTHLFIYVLTYLVFLTCFKAGAFAAL